MANFVKRNVTVVGVNISLARPHAKGDEGCSLQNKTVNRKKRLYSLFENRNGRLMCHFESRCPPSFTLIL